MDFIFKLGFSGELARQELASVLGKEPTKVAEGEYAVSLEGLPELNKLAARLGGLVEVVYADSKKTVWRHSAKYWIRADRDKPYLDPKKGLLPPKIARQLVNLAIGREVKSDQTLMDPFCGSGTILMEAAHLGLKVIGSDQDRQQVAAAEKNLVWAKAKFKLVLADATSISKYVDQPVDFIVTEPFMGKTKYRPDEINNIAKGLRKLYLGSLKDWLKVLAPNAKVVMLFPTFKHQKGKVVTSDIIDHPSLSGYNTLARGTTYSRPDAQIEREIIILEKK